ncbi:MAG: hypothetical protein R3324_18670, partial [Halobacteriales archaeon]|nr:hypothetical protein [Halobacteriales archaeon]
HEPVPGHDCTTLIGQEDREMGDVLLVEMVDSPRDRLSTWMSGTNGTNVRELTIVGIDGFSSAPEPPIEAADSISVKSIASPNDITSLGVKVSDSLVDQRNAWPTTVCLHSLTTLLQYTDLETVFQFVHTLSGHFARTNALAHCHLDPTAVDERAVNTLRPIFDVVIGMDEGDPHVVSSPKPMA